MTLNTDLPGSNGGDTRIHVYTGDCGTLTCVAGNDDISDSNYLSFTTFNGVSGTNYYIAFDNRWSASGFDFVLSLTPVSCFPVPNFSLDNRGLNTADISWTNDNGNSATWDIEYGTQGFTQGSGTLVSNIMSTNYQFTSLNENTPYHFYIRSNCNGINENSDWSGPYNFITLFDCSYYDMLPYTEDFHSENILNSCYTIIDADGDGAAWFQQTFTSTSENFAGNTLNGNNAKDDWLISPPITLVDGTDYSFSFTFNGQNDSGTLANENLEVLLIDANTNTANVLHSLYNETGIPQTGPSNQLEPMATTINSTYSSTVNGTYYLAFHTYSPPNSSFLLLFDYSINEVLSVEEFETTNFKYVFNSNLDILNLTSSQNPFSAVEVFNLSGQKVISNKLSQTNETINLSNVSDGVYLVKIYINNKHKVIKLVKY